MASKFSKFTATLALGAAFLVTPALLDPASPFAIDSAFAGKGGNGNGGGNGGGNGNGNGNGGSGKASSSHGNSGNKAAKKVNHGATASATAFANPSPNSRVGRIAAYGAASAAAVESGEALLAAQDQLASLNETVTNYYTALADLTTAEEKFGALAPALQAIVDDSLATDGAKAAAATTELQGLNDAVDAAQIKADGLQAAADAAAAQIPGAEATVDQAEIDADAAEAAAEDALNFAANKTPVSEETKAALDALIAGKITEVAIEQ